MNERHPSPLAWHGPAAHRGASGRAIQAALNRLFSNASARSLGELMEALRRPAMSPFAWVRSLELHRNDDGADDWQSGAEGNEDDDGWN